MIAEPVQSNYIGQKFNFLTILKKDKPKKGRGDLCFLCICDCGVKKKVTFSKLKSNHTKSCGCYNRVASSSRNFKDISGKRVGKLTVLYLSGKISGRYKWKCLCDCGNLTEVSAGNLTKKFKPISSCGCLKKIKGDLHWNWKSSISIEDRLNKRGVVKNVKYDEWRNLVFLRDNFSCVLTGSRYNIQSHHIESWNSNLNLRFDVNNGITLSKDIHDLFHCIYGRGNNTRKQFDEFIKGMDFLI